MSTMLIISLTNVRTEHPRLQPDHVVFSSEGHSLIKTKIFDQLTKIHHCWTYETLRELRPDMTDKLGRTYPRTLLPLTSWVMLGDKILIITHEIRLQNGGSMYV
jgi:hypothetical protein